MKDIVAVDIETYTVRVMDRNKTERNAEAYVNMAVMRRGVEKEFFAAVDAGMYKDGDKYHGHTAEG